ncbi:multiubiquitin domain-containing protein [Bradyrhizobium arachidis]|uniref:multiubiquitin domain-containing protein n=1 Tax=Bradyrhizobium arachidis TaxID=858423 RepID=UPI0021614D8D|nr:multiubiquitin domain-containing protein [Bradyrhizobium arachidis]UVO35740.1 multiubiquitin domain-containing protein [Bradyrhizobium arachidis]
MEHHEPGTPTNREKELEAFKERQLRELREFEERQKQELEQFERRELEELKEFEGRQHPYEIKIDRTEFKVTEHFLTGAQLRALPSPPIGPDRDLFEVVPGGSDEKIADTQKVKMRDGLRFFTAPAQINPGLV